MKKFFIVSIALLISLLGITSFDVKVGAVGSGSEAACDSASHADTNPGDTGSTTPFTFNFDAGAGNIVTGVCIKSGSNMFGDSHSGMLGNGTFESGCYTVSGVGTQFLTVTRNNSGSSCQGISHLDIDVDTAVTPTDVTTTPTETVTPSVSVSPTSEVTPTETITPTEIPSLTPSPTNPCEGASCNTGGNSPTPTSEVTATPTVTVTSTPSATATPTSPAGATATPTSAPIGGTSTTTQPTGTVAGVTLSTSSGPAAERVLGASAMAATGTFEQTLMALFGVMGTALIGLGFYSYRSELKKK